MAQPPTDVAISKKVGTFSKLLDKLGRIVLVYSIFATLSKLDEWDELLEFVKTTASELSEIVDLIENFTVIAVIPWELMSAVVFGLIPINIPEAFHDPLLICALMAWLPSLVYNSLIFLIVAQSTRSLHVSLARTIRTNYHTKDRKLIATQIIDRVNNTSSQLIGLGVISDYCRALSGNMNDPWLQDRKRRAMSVVRSGFDAINKTQREFDREATELFNRRKWSSRAAIAALVLVTLRHIFDGSYLFAVQLFLYAILLLILLWVASLFFKVLQMLFAALVVLLGIKTVSALDMATGRNFRLSDSLKSRIVKFFYKAQWRNWDENREGGKVELFELGECSLQLLAVTSRTVVWLFLEQAGVKLVPVLHRLQGRLAA